MLLLFYPHSNSVLQLQTVAWSSWRQDCASDVKCVVLVLRYGHKKSATIPNARNVRRLYRRDVWTRSMQWMADFAALKVVVSTIVDEVANDDDDDDG